MIYKNHLSRWGLISQGFHWLIALLILLAAISGLIAENLENSPLKIKLFVLHKSFGISILALAILRIVWRWANVTPQPASGIGAVNHRLAGVGHNLLYVLMFAVPLSGWILNSAANFPFRWMNWVSVPNLQWVPSNWQQLATAVHWWLFVAFALLLSVHITMAVFHHRFHRSDLLLRMLPIRSTVGFFSIFITSSVLALWGSLYWAQGSPVSLSSEAPTTASVESEPALAESNNRTDRLWRVFEGGGKLAFTGNYADEPFEGEFKRFEADLFFDPQNPETGLFRATVDTTSITAYSEDFDSSLVEPEWFHVKRYPEATYLADDFEPTQDGFIANGILTIKGLRAKVPLRFQWLERQDGKVDFSATAVVDRRVFGIGLGEWANDPTIGFDVKVQVDLLLVQANGE